MTAIANAPRRSAALQPLERLAPVLTVAALVGTWALAVAVFDPAPYLLPSPSAVAAAAWRTRGVLGEHVTATAIEAVLGLGLGAAAGALLALVLSLSSPLRRAVQPLLVVSQSVPMVVLAPVLIVWFGFGIGPRLLVVALISFFPVAIAALDALLDADPDLVELVRSLGGGPSAVLWRIRLPNALPGFFAGLKVSSAYAMFGAVIAEWMGAERGLGVYLQRSQASFRTDQLFAAVIVIAVTSIGLFAVVTLLARVAMPWQRPEPASTPSIGPTS